jgi:hypothetical protein
MSTASAREVQESAEPAATAAAAPPASAIADFAELASFGPQALTPKQLLGLQRQAGNRAVSRAILARQDKPAATEADILAWPTSLPRSNRGDTEALSVTLHTTKTAPTLNNEAAGGTPSAMDDKKRAVVDAIAKARAAFATGNFSLNPYNGTWGWMYSGVRRGLGPDPTPTQLTTPPTGADPKRVKAQLAIWAELQSEGGAGSINAYDEQVFTWGRGLGAASGPAGAAMDAALADTTVKNPFLKIGLTRENKSWLVVNTASGAIESGGAALQLMAGRLDILAAIAGVSEDPAVRQKVVDAQWTVISAGAADVPTFAYDWDPHVIQVAAHITHGGPKYGWGVGKALYQATGGDMAKVLLAWGQLRCEKPEVPSGAFKVSTQTTLTAQWMRQLGDGISAKTLAVEASGPLDITDEKIKNDTDLAGHLVLKMPEGGFYVLPRVSPDKEKQLGPNVHTAYLTRLDQMWMKYMLPEIAKLGSPLLLDHFFSIDAKIHAAPITNEERLWWAYKVVRNKSVPPPPAAVTRADSSTFNPVPNDQVVEAYEYLKQPVPAKYKPQAAVARMVMRAVVNTPTSIDSYYKDGGAPDAAQLKKAVDMQTDIDKLDALEIAARDALDAAAKKGDPVDATKLAELTKVRREVEQALTAQIALLEQLQAAKPAPPAPVPDSNAKPAKKKAPTAQDVVVALWGAGPTNPLEAAKAHLDRLKKWEIRLQIADLTSQIAKLTDAADAEKKKDLVTKRRALVDQLHAGIHDIKQFTGPWAEWNYADTAGKATFDYDTGQTAKVRSSACGPTSLALVLDYLSESDPEGLLARGQDLQGSDLVKWALDYAVGAGAHAVKAGSSYKGTKYEKEGAGMTGSEGTSGDTMAGSLQKTLGSLRGKALGTDTAKAKEEIDQGNLIVVLGPGHFVVMDDYKDGTGAGSGFHIFEVGNKFGATGWTNDWAAHRASQQAAKEKATTDDDKKKIKVPAAFVIQGMWSVSGGY